MGTKKRGSSLGTNQFHNLKIACPDRTTLLHLFICAAYLHHYPAPQTELNFWLISSAKHLRSSWLGPHLYTRIWVCALIAQLKTRICRMQLSFCQSGWREIRNPFLVISCVCWEPRTRISGTLRPNDATATRTSLKKWICVLSIFVVITPTHLLCQM